MDWWQRSILNKILAIALISASIVLSAGIYSALGAYHTAQEFRLIFNEEVQAEKKALLLTISFKKQVQEWKNVLLRGADDKQRNKYWDKFEKEEQAVQAQGQELLPLLHHVEAREKVSTFLKEHKAMGLAYRKGFDAFVASGYDSHVGDLAVKGVDRAPTELLGQASVLIEAETNVMLGDSFASSDRTNIIGAILMLIGLVVAFLSFMSLSKRYIVTPSQQLAVDLDRIAGGDFRLPVKISSKDEIGQVALCAHRLQTDLGTTIEKVLDVVKNLASAAGSLSTIASETSQGIQRQHSETDQVATAINEMSSTVQEVSNHATQAANAAAEADNQANTGMRIVTSTIGSINQLVGEVQRSSNVIKELERNTLEIGSVLDVIKGIAEQTNLLALNAAIEAARAGEQGRGFAVVADEVRTLAQRTQKSTQEIQGMIERLQSGAHNAVNVMENSQAKASETVGEAAKAEDSLNAIVGAIGLINDMNTQIASAAEEQAAVSEEINRSISSISQISEISSKNMSATSSESDAVASLSQALQQLVAKFRV